MSRESLAGLVSKKVATSKRFIEHLETEQNEKEKVEVEKGVKDNDGPIDKLEQEIKDMNINMVFNESDPKAKSQAEPKEAPKSEEGPDSYSTGDMAYC